MTDEQRKALQGVAGTLRDCLPQLANVVAHSVLERLDKHLAALYLSLEDSDDGAGYGESDETA